MMDLETWLSAEKAIELGFADEVDPWRLASATSMISQSGGSG